MTATGTAEVLQQPVGILLAAGRGIRFGSQKLLHVLADGRPMAVASAQAMRAALDRVVATVAPGEAALAALLRGAGCEVVICANAGGGMGASLACAIGQAASAPGWVIALADMPFVRSETIRTVAAALAAGASIAVPVLADGRRGHPVGFAGGWRSALLALQGDAGGRSILAANPGSIVALATDDGGCVIDIDRPDDLIASPP